LSLLEACRTGNHDGVEGVRKLFVYISGISQGNPGTAAIGVALLDAQGHAVEEISQVIGRASPLVAEYKALLSGCRAASSYAPEDVVFFSDSNALVNQVSGVSQPREPHLQRLKQLVGECLAGIPRWRMNYVAPDANSVARRLAERAFHERVRTERQRARLVSELNDLLSLLSLDELRKVESYIQSLRAKTS
jgi:ribonuclease HI